MNILYILQQSIYTSTNPPKWRTADSNIQMMRGILDQLTQHTDWKFWILIAPLADFDDLKDYKELIDHPNVKFVFYDFPVDAFWNRQHFNIFEFSAMWDTLPEIDVVWNNITELSRNIKTFLYFKKSKAKLVTCCYWLDCPEIGQEKVDKSISYDWRQIDGFECSDLAVFTCKSTLDAFWLNAMQKIDAKYVSNIKAKSVIWDFGYSQKEMNSTVEPFQYPKKTISFLNRMSGINYTHHLEFINAVNKLATTRSDFQVIFTNPSQKISWDWLKNNVTNMHIITKNYTRKQYLELLWSSDITVHLFEKELYGGCAHRESIHCGNIVVTPKIAEYLNIQGEEYPFYVDGSCLETSLCEVLDKALDKITLLYNKYSDKCATGSPEFTAIKERNKQSSFEVVKNRVINDLERIVKS